MASGSEYAELQAMTNFSFLMGGSHPEEIVHRAAALRYRAIAITDLNSLAGVVRAHTAAKEAGIQCIIGAKLALTAPDILCAEGAPSFHCEVLVHPRSRRGYGNLCRLLSTGKLRAAKGECVLSLEDLLHAQEDLFVTACPPSVPLALSHRGTPREDLNFYELCRTLQEGLSSPECLSIAISRAYLNGARTHLASILQTARALSVPLLATNDALYHTPDRRPIQDVLTCIRHHTTIGQAGFLLSQNSERYLKDPTEMKRLFRDLPEAIQRGLDIAADIRFSLDELSYEYPHEICPTERAPHEWLATLAWDGARERYRGEVPEKVAALIEEELALIRELRYEHYFLTCYDIVSFARKRGILCQGRGAAANSAVCFALGITSVDPNVIDLLFARFVSKERNEPPDIDIDFEHERREEVIQYIYEKYGRHRAGLVCEVVTYRHRSAVREVGKALGLPSSTIDILAKLIHRWDRCVISREDLVASGLSPADNLIHTTLTLASELLSFPRHLSQHVGGFILSEAPLSETVPILNASMEDRTIIEWDKDDIEALGMLKIDVLGLGMLTCIRKALSLVRDTTGRSLDLHTIPKEDPKVYDMVCRADTVGVFQIESRAQMSMLPRLKPRCFYDLVVEVAIVRPGPIQGNMVHPYLRRRSGLETIQFPDARVEEILGKTLGVPLFQEQAMRLAIVLANFTPGEAERLRRAMGAWKRNKRAITAFEEKITAGMLQNGYTIEFAKSCISQIKGFSEYGFPESHAASFALLVYASAWLKCHHPAEFAAALINSQPMGFYAPSQIVRDARTHGIAVLPIDIRVSRWDCSIEHGALRLGMRLIKGLSEAQAKILETLPLYSCRSPREIFLYARRSGLPLQRSSLAALARADAFASLGISRREALWEVRALPLRALPLDPVLEVGHSMPALPQMTRQQSMFEDYSSTGLSLSAHPLTFLRERLTRQLVKTASQLPKIHQKNVMIAVAGLAICRQRPSTSKGTVFVTLEDETGSVNLIVRPAVYERYRRIVVSATILLAFGKFERTGDVMHLNVRSLESLDSALVEVAQVQLPGRSYSY